jgi:hypothetical protein
MTETDTKTESFLRGKELADRLKIDPATLRTWRKYGLPHQKIGYKTIRYRFSDVLAWLASKEAGK